MKSEDKKKLIKHNNDSINYIHILDENYNFPFSFVIFPLQPLDKHSLISTQQSDRRSISPSPRRLGEFKKKQHSLDFNGTTVNGTINETETSTNDVKVPETNKTVTHSAATPMPNSPTSATAPTNGSTTTTGDVGKFENISDNGSEISDEGYRSLGLIQQGNSQAKRTSLHSQASVEDVKTEDVKAEDAKMNGRLRSQLC